MVYSLDPISLEHETGSSYDSDTTTTTSTTGAGAGAGAVVTGATTAPVGDDGIAHICSLQGEYCYGNHTPEDTESVALPHLAVSSGPENHGFIPELNLQQNDRVASKAPKHSAHLSHHLQLIDQTLRRNSQSESDFIESRNLVVSPNGSTCSSLGTNALGSDREPETTATHHRSIIHPQLNGSLEATISYNPC